jgi:hypothetical protein
MTSRRRFFRQSTGLAMGALAGQSAQAAEAMPVRVQFDVLRPTGFSAYSREWKP